MKKILGLDIGTTSIGWAIVEAIDEKKANERTGETFVTDINNERTGIYQDAVGVRIIPQDSDNVKSFNEGKKLIQKKTTTPTAKRRVARGSRRMKSRYKLRRGKLTNVLSFLNMNPDERYYTNQKGKRGEGNDIGNAIYSLRDRAIREGITLPEWGRILLHLNQWRGYSSDRFKKEDESETDNDFYTSLVISVTEKQKIYKGKQNPKVEKVVFEVTFENGDVGIDIVSFGEKSYSQFKQNEFATYKKEIKEKDDGTKEVILKWQKLKEDDWVYRKWKLNKGIDGYISEDRTNRTVGSYFYKFFYDSNTPQDERIDRIRNNVVNRDWYEDEFDKIWNFQFEKHKEHFEKINIEDVVEAVFKDFKSILNEVSKKQGIKEQLRFLIKDKIIYYQRPWQQAKNKGECPFEFVPDVKKEKDGSFIPNPNGKKVIDKNGNEIYVKGRTVIPRSHPLFQEYKIWQQINNVRLFLNDKDERTDLLGDSETFKKYTGKTIEEVKELLFKGLENSKTLSWRVFVKDKLGIKNVFDEIENKDNKKRKTKQGVDVETGEIADLYFSVNFRKKKKDGTFDDIKLKGNTTKATLQTILTDKNEEWFYQIHSDKQQISNLQLLWEIIYDITNAKADDVSKIIKKHFADFDTSVCDKLASVSFDDSGMGNLSAKAIRQLLPLMSNGNNLTEKAKARIQSLITLNNDEKEKDNDEKLESIKNFVSDKKARLRLSEFTKAENFKYLNYWEAAAVVYGSHSTKKTNIQAEISRVKQHSMNNPVVEKIVNETIAVVNEIYKVYGFDEVRIELSRELRASMDERQQMWEAMQSGYEKNEWAKKMLRELKQALKEDNRSIENIDDEPSKKSNVDKIRIVEDVVRYQQKEGFKEEKFKLDEPSKAEIIRYLLWLQQNFKCPYTNQPIPLTDVFARGKVVEIEHIIPKERYYSNAYSNKVLTWQKVNQAKANNGNRTAYEFIVSKRVENEIEINGKKYPLVSAEEWKEHIESMFPKGAKRNNLLRKDIPEDPIERTLKETQYINKKLKEKLAELVGESKVWVTSGAVTDILREKWHLNDVMRELLRERYENFKIPMGKKTFQLKTTEEQKSFNEEIKSVIESSNVFNEYKLTIENNINESNINKLKTKIADNKIFQFHLKTIDSEIEEIEKIEDTDKFKEKVADFLKQLEKLNYTKKIGKKGFEFGTDELKRISDELDKIIAENEQKDKPVPYKYETSEESFEVKSLIHWAKEYNNKTQQYKDVEKFTGYSKRVDHRHHALDAIIIACTKQNHIQYINNLNAINTVDQEDENAKKVKYETLKKEICEGNSSTKFKTPWEKDKFIPTVKNCLNEIAVSHKNTRLLISPSKHRIDKEIKSGKVASIRGELHKETNYASKNYFTGDRLNIDKLIPLLLKKKMENQLQTMVLPKSFQNIIRERVLKEKYQNILIPLFDKYETLNLNSKTGKKADDKSISTIQKDILKEITENNLLIDSKTGKPLQWLSVYSDKDKTSRPLGLSMDLNSAKEIKDIANHRIKKLAEYRLSYVNEKIAAIDKLDIDKKEKDKLKAKEKSLKLYSNAIYEVRIITGENKFKWIELKDLTTEDLDKISYAKEETTKQVKERLAKYDLVKLKSVYFENPVFLSERPIEVKKVRQKSYFQNLYEITPKRYVQVEETFLTYFFQEKGQEETVDKLKVPKFLKFIDAVNIIDTDKPDKIDYTKLIDKEKSNEESLNGIKYELAFTLAKNDLVYLPDSELADSELKEIDWNNKVAILSNLYIVKDMNPSQNKIVFQQFYKADSINISEDDTKSLFNVESKNGLSEEIKYGTVDMLQRCVKVFTDRLGRKIVPYWEFPNGYWNKKRAQELELVYT